MKVRRVATDALIAFHLVAIPIWIAADDQAIVRHESRVLDAAQGWIQPWMAFSGLWQSWDTFSPEPQSINFALEAQLTFADGGRATWVFPGPEGKGFFAMRRWERWRKWRGSVRLDDNAYLWPDTARFIARLFAARDPVRVELVRRWDLVDPPADPPGWPPPCCASRSTFFTYDVRPEDLR